MATLHRLGETALLRLITDTLDRAPAAALNHPAAVGPGDDAAVTHPAGALASTTDMLVAGQDFLPAWLDLGELPDALCPGAGLRRAAGTTPGGWYRLGVKAAAQNLADVFAMGARPHGLLVSLGLPGDTESERIEEFYAGLLAECARAGTGVLGGDIGAAGELIVSITALGDYPRSTPPLRRSGARPGDTVYLAGTVGFAAAGLDLLLAGVRPGEDPDLDLALAVQLGPRPDYAAAARLPGWAHAGIDASDGMVGDLGRIARASQVVIDLDPDAIDRLSRPLLPAARALRADGAPALDLARHWVLTGGEDHGFLVTAPTLPGTGANRAPVKWEAIGTVTRRAVEAGAPDAGGALGIHLAGAAVADGAFRHFA
ncbi:thiamine-phosphate kinase [Brevibacterium sp. 50QC2O2]|uniref:thiamine-phosphate kinase n=1 Tax=Brevibacterium TaxID=1696 RepID=UPI00211C6EB0|nr:MULTISPECIES: thiamine-phosphate kinase [unclassified Brevibacterium]MCQ9367801.1 thiamine-phosphate kinase [Brevibacterium sp. 91QC2O2]MCQ9384893.1 thiamine-phosphate kinase [Brevibacterium sp. 68QC2CO]MCQ9388060.1 thiamine-phosphate kinase [Brevibacterium sp. 50QC2O2]